MTCGVGPTVRKYLARRELFRSIVAAHIVFLTFVLRAWPRLIFLLRHLNITRIEPSKLQGGTKCSLRARPPVDRHLSFYINERTSLAMA